MKTRKVPKKDMFIYIPHSSDKTRVQCSNLDWQRRFTFHIVQIKLGSIYFENYPRITIYIPHSSDKTRGAGAVDEGCSVFTFHIVQIKPAYFFFYVWSNHRFTFHIVQIKLILFRTEGTGNCLFTFHIVQIKPCREGMDPAWHFYLHST